MIPNPEEKLEKMHACMHGREYIIYPAVGFCSCNDFFFAVMKGEVLACCHLLSQRLAEELNDYDVVEAEDRLFDPLMEGWKEIGARPASEVLVPLQSPTPNKHTGGAERDV